MVCLMNTPLMNVVCILMSVYYKDNNEYSYMNVFLCDDCIFEYIKMLQRGKNGL